MNAFDAMSGFWLHFLRPWWWLALAPLPLALWMLMRSGGGRAALARLADATLLPYLVRDEPARQRTALAIAALAWLLAVAALAGPAWQKVEAPLYVNGAARVVALSLSDDMLAQDLKPDRMTRARFAVHDLLDAAGDARTALVAYAGAAFTVAPLTDDKRTVENFLAALQPNVMPVPGNDAAAGIRQAVKLLEQSQVQGGEVVLVTDTAGGAAIAAARSARAQGIRVDVLGIGTPEGAPVPRSGGGFAGGPSGVLMARRDDAALRAVAAAGGGRYAVLQADGSGVAAFGAPVATATGHASRGNHAQLWRDGGVWLLPALLVLAALAFRRGWLLVLAVLVLPIGMPAAHAASLQSWFANRDQRAWQALQHGDPGAAKKLATTPGLRGAADYRKGDYAEAAKSFADGSGARSRYNLGNALAKQGEYAKAIDAYRQALRQDPEMADARTNLDAVEQWLKQHPPPPSSGGQSTQSSNDNQQSSGAGSSSNQQGGQQQSASAGQRGSSSSAASGSQASGAPQGSGSQQQGRGRHTGRAGEQQAPFAGEAATQNRQTEQAKQGLSRELQRADRAAGSGSKSGAFALGQSQQDHRGPFDAQQRAMLNAVPDDPGALLRRKFRLEWEQREGRQPQEDGQP